ncbi:MAG: hypothetical protein K6V73_02560 [Firmicutes bacterium]|nr:hypothetical protein [Bacillota bacterium]
MPARGVDPARYESRLAAFHLALARAGVPGLIASRAERVRGAPWLGDAGYADWYLVRDMAALGDLNRLAVAGEAGEAHAAVAALSGPGAGSVFALVRGDGAGRTAWWWLAKARGIAYDTFYASLPATVTLWRRQMVLGPTPEFALGGEAAPPSGVEAVRTEHAPVAVP